MAGTEVREQIQRIRTLPSLSGVVKKLCALSESDISSAAEVGDIVSTDQVLTARVLKIVNSSFYGFEGRVGTINHALVLLGFNVVKSIVITAAVIDCMTASMVGLWEHSLGVATAANHVARTLKISNPEETSTAGLLHDLGKVILHVEMRDVAEHVQASVNLDRISFIEAERQALDGLTHCDIVGWLAEEWNLPPRLREPLVLHHSPNVAEFARVPTAIVHISDVITRALQFGSGGDPYVPRIHPAALDVLGLKIGDLAPLLQDIDDAFEGLDTSELT
jgi:HD-like signal output (HDOD) protein